MYISSFAELTTILKQKARKITIKRASNSWAELRKDRDKANVTNEPEIKNLLFKKSKKL